MFLTLKQAISVFFCVPLQVELSMMTKNERKFK